MSEGALTLVVAFILLIPMTWLSIRWLWTLVCQEAGVTRQEVRVYRIKMNREMNPHRAVYPWMLSHSQNPKKFKRLFLLYQACMLPDLLCLFLAVTNLVASSVAFYNFLACASYVMATLPVVLSGIGVIYRKIKG